MQKLKFRAWNPRTGTWEKNFFLWSDGDRSTAVDDCYITQYSGLWDMNKNDIYEGDILTDDVSDETGEVIFDEGCFSLVHGNVVEPLSEVNEEFRVIGNIYENKDLLEAKA